MKVNANVTLLFCYSEMVFFFGAIVLRLERSYQIRNNLTDLH